MTICRIYPSRIWSYIYSIVFLGIALTFGYVSFSNKFLILNFVFVPLTAFTGYAAMKVFLTMNTAVAELDDEKIRFSNFSGAKREILFADIRGVGCYFVDGQLVGLELSFEGGKIEKLRCGILADAKDVFREIKQRSPHLRQAYSTVMSLAAVK